MSQRDEIAQVIRTTLWGELGRDAELVADNIADALLAAGLIVPPGLTAFELREIATWLTIRDPIDAADAAILAEMQTELRAWADFLDTQETRK